MQDNVFDNMLQVDRMDDGLAHAGGARYLNTNQHFHIGLRTLVPTPYEQISSYTDH
jgi:hypothetical protein